MNKKEHPVRDGKPIMVTLKTHERLTDAKKATGVETFDDLFLWLLEQVKM